MMNASPRANDQRNALPGPDDIAREVLPNGIVVLARENYSNQSVVITGSLAVGSLFDPEGKDGLAGFTAAALMRGTTNRDFDALHEELEGIGATLGISGNTHLTGFGGKALAEDLPTLLTLLSDALRHPAFPVDQTERLRGEILTGLRVRAQDTRSVAGKSFRKLAYPPEHPYSRSGGGEIETINAITLDDLAQFWRKHYGPRRMILVIVGALPVRDAIRQAQDVFGDWQNPDQPDLPALPPLAPIEEVRQEFKTLAGKTQSDIVLGWHGPARLDPDFQAANLANNILGVFGMMGRLGANVREKQGLAYYSYSSLRGGHGPGPWSVSAGVNPTNVRRAIDSILAEVDRLCSELVSEEELADNKANFTGSLPLSLENNEGVAGAIFNMELYGLGLDYLRRYKDMINAITREDVQRAAQRYLSKEAYALAVAGPELPELNGAG